MPCTPIAESASRTSSSLNGLMIAVTSFMFSPVCAERSERIGDEGHEPVLRPVLDVEPLPRDAGVLLVGVRLRVEAARARVLVAQVADIERGVLVDLLAPAAVD